MGASRQGNNGQGFLIFRRIEPSPNYRALRFQSDTGRWELGLSPYQHGIRVRMGLAGRPPSLMDFCLGHETPLYSPTLLAIMELLRSLPESASADEIDALFPWAGTRPDPTIHLTLLLTHRVSQPALENKKWWTGKDSNLQPID